MRLSVILFLFMLAAPAGFAGSENLKVEGVVTGIGKNPAQPAAIVNGHIVQPGDTVEGYAVTAVDEGGVTLTDPQTGEPVRLANGAVQAAGGETASAPAPEKSWFEAALEKHAPNLSALTKQFAYAGVINDLKLVHREAFMYFMDTGARTVSLGDLVARGQLPKFFQGGVSNGYRFRIQTLADGVRAYADPVEDDGSKKHFMIDEFSYVYMEDGKPATQNSPRMQNGFNLTVQPSP